MCCLCGRHGLFFNGTLQGRDSESVEIEVTVFLFGLSVLSPSTFQASCFSHQTTTEELMSCHELPAILQWLKLTSTNKIHWLKQQYQSTAANISPTIA
jgi:hypothetical protein